MADAIQEAQKLYLDALEASSEQREQMEEDLRFSDPSDPEQWDAALKRAREADPGGARPCLVFDQTGQYVANVAGQIEQRPPALHAIPVEGGADKRVAEQLDGFYRHIEHTSRAQQHYARALTSAARAGVGYLIVRPEYVNRALNWQEPRIGSEGDPLRVVFDPWSVELDGSDANFGFLLTPFSHREFEAKFGAKAEKVSFSDESRSYVRDERESIIVAEQWQIQNKTANMIIFVGADGEEAATSEEDYWKACSDAGVQLPVVRTYNDTYRCVKWSRMSGSEALTKETEYPASGIGIVPVYGYVGWSNGRMKYCGIPRRAMSPQRSYNYHMSETHAFMATAPKSPWMASQRALRGLEPIWDRASVDTRAYLPFNDIDAEGPIAPPSRTPITINLANHMQGAERALADIQASLGMYQANLGAPSNETSGVAIEGRKQQGEASTAHFPAHLAAGIGQVGKLVMEMIPRLIDTKRQLRILGIDNAPSNVTLDPSQSEALQESPQGLIINPNVGRYDVRVVVGASFSTQRQQAQAAFTEMMRANPNMTPAIAPLWAQTLDVPHADKLAQVLTAVAPPEVKAILDPDAAKQPTTAELMSQVQQLQAGLQEAIQHAQEAQQEADQLRAEKEEAEDKNAIAAYDAETKRLVGLKDAISPEQVQQLVVQTIETMMSNPEPLPGESVEEPVSLPEAPAENLEPMQ